MEQSTILGCIYSIGWFGMISYSPRIYLHYSCYSYRFWQNIHVHICNIWVYPNPDRGQSPGLFHKSERLGFITDGRVCNIFQRPFSAVSALPSHPVNGPRRATKAITPCIVLKYRKIGEGAL